MYPLVTVAIPCFNAENTIERAIESAQNQDWPTIEILVVDDASEDATVSIIEGLAKEDKRIRLMCHEANQGVAVARNTLLGNARGEFIAFFDADDVSYPERICLQYQRLTNYEQRNKADLILCYGGKKVISLDGTEPYEKKGVGYKSPEPLGRNYVENHFQIKEHKGSYEGHFASCALFMRATVFDFVGPFDPVLRRGQDGDYMIRAGLKGAHLISVDQTLIDWYRTEADYKTDEKILYYRRLRYQKYRYLFSNEFRYFIVWNYIKAGLCFGMAKRKKEFPLMMWYWGWRSFWHSMISPRAVLMPRTRFKRALRNVKDFYESRRAHKGAIARRKAGE